MSFGEDLEIRRNSLERCCSPLYLRVLLSLIIKPSNPSNVMSNTCTKVFLRRRPYVGGKVSLYLDYYPAIRNPHTNKMTRRETLGIVIFADPANEMQRRFNQEMEEKAEAIRCIRYQSLVNEQFGFLDKTKLKMDFLAYFEKKAKSKYDKWMSVYLHFKKFCGGHCTFGVQPSAIAY